MYAKHILRLRRRGGPFYRALSSRLLREPGTRYLGAVIKDTINGPPIKYN